MQGLTGVFDFGSGSGVASGKEEGSYKESLTGNKRYIELINGVRYAIKLEYGSSPQAPYGTVRISMREMIKDILPQNLGKELQKEWKKFRG